MKFYNRIIIECKYLNGPFKHLLERLRQFIKKSTEYVRLLLPTTFTAKCQLIFVLLLENAYADVMIMKCYNRIIIECRCLNRLFKHLLGLKFRKPFSSKVIISAWKHVYNIISY